MSKLPDIGALFNKADSEVDKNFWTYAPYVILGLIGILGYIIFYVW